MLAWDRSRDWVLKRFCHDLTRLTIRFRRVPPEVTELAALRRCLPQFRDLAPATVREMIATAGALPLGMMTSPEADRLLEILQGQGLLADAENASCVCYLPFDCTTGCAW